MRAFLTLIEREIKIRIASPTFFITSFTYPIFFFLIFGPLVGGIVKTVDYGGHYLSYIEFMLPGIIVMVILYSALYAGVSTYSERLTGIEELEKSLPIRKGFRPLSKVISTVIQMLVLCIMILAAGSLITNVLSFTKVIIILAFASFFCIGLSSLSIISTSFIKDSTTYVTLVGLIIFPLLFISTSFYPVYAAPTWVKTITLINPISHMSSLLRDYLILNTLNFWSIIYIIIFVGLCFILMILNDKSWINP
jgi:ABC-2 type transport system permease protein